MICVHWPIDLWMGVVMCGLCGRRMFQLSFSPLGMVVPSLCIHNFSALFLCPIVQRSLDSRPEIVMLTAGWD